jgi:hypothetical protein
MLSDELLLAFTGSRRSLDYVQIEILYESEACAALITEG